MWVLPAAPAKNIFESDPMSPGLGFDIAQTISRAYAPAVET
jgi:hypothetical protein